MDSICSHRYNPRRRRRWRMRHSGCAPGTGRIASAATLGSNSRKERTDHESQFDPRYHREHAAHRSEEHTSELQSLMRISYAVFCLKKKKKQTNKRDIAKNT